MPLPLLDRLLATTGITALDIGARDGFISDLAPIAAGVDAIGLEPDEAECDRLNASARVDTNGYRSLRYFPVAVGSPSDARMLNLYRARGCTSLLEGDVEFARQFAREHFFILDEQIAVAVERLDDAAQGFDFTHAHFMKIDIQGAELEVFLSGPKLVGQSLLAIRTEIEFVPVYKDQPVFADVDAELREKGFMFVGFPELHAWRRGTEAELNHWTGGAVPLSEGQLVHGDALYLRRPETMSAETAIERERLIVLALLAFAYGYVDFCAELLTGTQVGAHVRETSDIDPVELVAELGKWSARLRRRGMGKAALGQLRDYLRIALR